MIGQGVKEGDVAEDGLLSARLDRRHQCVLLIDEWLQFGPNILRHLDHHRGLKQLRRAGTARDQLERQIEAEGSPAVKV